MSTFYRQDDKVIRPWCKWSWDPLTGCENDCDFCVPRDKIERFHAQTRDTAYESFSPRLWPERFDAPYNTPIPGGGGPGERNVFLNSLGDLFGPWVETEHVEAILNIVRDTPQWNYIVVTKHPGRCSRFPIPSNVWLGVKIDKQHEVRPALDVLDVLDASVRFIACDPLVEWLEFPTLSCVEWLIVGARPKTKKTEAFMPPRVWVSSLIREAERWDCKVFVKHMRDAAYKRFPGDKRGHTKPAS